MNKLKELCSYPGLLSLAPTIGCSFLAIVSCLLLVSVFVDVPTILFVILLAPYLMCGYFTCLFLFFSGCRVLWFTISKKDVLNDGDYCEVVMGCVGMIIFGFCSAFLTFAFVGLLLQSFS